MALSLDRLEAREDLLLGHILLNRNFITPEQLKQALAEQAAGLARGRKKPRRLGVILAEQGRITDRQYVEFRQEIEERIREEEVESEEDRRLAGLLRAYRTVPPERLEECLRVQGEAMERGDMEIPRLAELLLSRGYVTAETLTRAMTILKKQQIRTRPPISSPGRPAAGNVSGPSPATPPLRKRFPPVPRPPPAGPTTARPTFPTP